MSGRADYDELVRLAEREFELVRREAYSELPEVWAEREELIDRLPESSPVEARRALERAASIQGQCTNLLELRKSSVAGELRRIDRGRTAMHGYAAAAPRVPLVDRAG